MSKQEVSYWEVLRLYLPLSLVSFGGPQAHVALLHNIFVEEEQWISNQKFTELFAIAQALPGPASSQLAFAITLVVGGALKSLAAFLMWTLPGTIIMIGFAYGINSLGEDLPRWLLFVVNGLTSAAVGLVALAAYKIGSKVLADKFSILLAVISASLAINFTAVWFLPVLMMSGGLLSWVEEFVTKTYFENKPQLEPEETQVGEGALTVADESGAFEPQHPIPETAAPKKKTNLYRNGLLLFGLWLVLLILSVVARSVGVPRGLDIFTTLYFVGSVIFGGGPVVIPVLQSFVVEGQWMSNREFLIGLALINCMPGPNFNLGAFCGALAIRTASIMFLGGLLGSFAIFLPGMLLIAAFIPLWQKYRQIQSIQSVFRGVNAAAVGLVHAAVYILAQKSIAPTAAGATDGTDQLTNYPLYTAVAALTFTSVGFVQLQAPAAVFLGGLVGLIDWLINK
jgi:putative chromate ion transporter